MDERRELPRWEIKKEARAWIPLLQGFDHCMVEDMHLKGMCIAFNKRLPHQKHIRMSFAFGDSYDFIKFEADIPWMREEQGRYVYGLCFTKVNDEEKDKIAQYIQANCYDQVRSKWWEGNS